MENFIPSLPLRPFSPGPITSLPDGGTGLSFTAAQSLSVSQVDMAFQNLKRRYVQLLLKKGIITASIATVARTANVATITTDVAHGMIVGQRVDVNAGTDHSFDSTTATVIAVPSATSFTYSSTGSDKSATADSGTLTTWEVVTDSGHAPWGNPRIQSISGAAITVTFDSLPAGSKVLAGTIGNHSNSYGGRIVPHFGAIGATTVSFQFRQSELVHGRVYWNGTTTGGGITANANWVKEGDAASASFVASAINALVIGHSSNRITTSGSRGASSWVPPMVNGPAGVRVALPNFQVPPFTAAAYQPSDTGFYVQFANPTTGAIMDQTALEALAPASTVQVVWSRQVDTLVSDVNSMPFTVTVWADIVFITP